MSRSHHRTGAALLTTLLAQTIGSAAVFAPTVVAPLIAASMSLPVAAVGLYISAVYIGAMVTSVLSGPVVVALGGTRMSQLSLLACALGLLCVSSSFAPLALLGALIVGLGYGPLTPASSDVLIRAAPPHRLALIYSIKQTGVPLGGVIAGAVLPALALAAGWRWGLVWLALACLASAAIIAPFRSALDGSRSGRVRRPGWRDAIEPVRFTLRDRSLRILGAVSFVFSATQVSLTAYLVTFLTQDLRWQLIAAGLALSISQAAGMAGRVLWGWVADSGLGSRRTLILLASAMALSALSVLALDAATPRWAVVALMAVFGSTAVGWNGVFLAAVARLAPPGQTAVVTGGTLAFTYLGVVIGPLLFGAFATGTGSFATAFAALALPLVLCLALILRLVDGGRRLADG